MLSGFGISAAVLGLVFLSPTGARSQTDPPADILIRGNTTDDGLGASAALAGDVNGDGQQDVLVGADGFEDTEVGQGRVFLFYGPIVGNLGLQHANATITGESLLDGFGTSVAGAGDVNDDGFDDVLVGARSNDTAGIQAGRAYLFYGPLAGDLDALDADCIISGEPFDEVGWSLTGAGDLDGDGFDDVLIGAWMAGLNGAVYVFYGPLSGERGVASAEATVTGALSNELLGDAVASADLNADAVPDLILGAPRPPLDGVDTGRAYVFFGPVMGEFQSSDADVIIRGEEVNDEFGTSVAKAGDVNGDGSDDLIVGAHQLFRSGSGKAYVFHGPLAEGFLSAAEADAVLLGEPPISEEEDLFGEAVASGGDTNGDGFGDVLVAASNNRVGGIRAGRAYLFFGPLAGTIPAGSADRIFTGSEQNLFGTALAPLGDIGGDGGADFLVGAPTVFQSGVREYAAIFFGATTAGVEIETGEDDPARLQSWPNPADRRIRIVFDLPRAGTVNLRVFDSLGREVEALANGPHLAGRSEIVWEPAGGISGVYYCRLEVDGVSTSTKLVVK